MDEPTIQWLFDCFEWALVNFDAKVFFQDTQLVTPTNEHFPGQEHDAANKAKLIFEQTRQYAGLDNWPLALSELGADSALQSPRLEYHGALRGGLANVAVAGGGNTLPVYYDTSLLANPEAMIANYAHSLAHYLGAAARQAPPGGIENWAQTTEVLSVFLGFGLMFANSAYNVRVSGCGACQGHVAVRQSYLSQYDISYALAIFCVLKEIPPAQVNRYLKKTLRGYFKLALRDVNKQGSRLQALWAYRENPDLTNNNLIQESSNAKGE